MKKQEIKRGDLFFYDFGKREGSIQCGERPVLVLQADDYNRNAPTVVVASITSVMKKRYLPSHIALGEAFGLKKPSMVLLEQMQTINKAELTEYIGSIDDEVLLRQINSALKKTLGLWVFHNENKNDIHCLCPTCLKDYLNAPEYLVRRADPFAKAKDKCDKCDNMGWDYHIIERKSNAPEGGAK